MKITVTTLSEKIFFLDVAEDLELENFKAFCEVETGFPSTEFAITHNGQHLLDIKKTLKDYGISDGDCVVLQHINDGQQPGANPGELPLLAENFLGHLFWLVLSSFGSTRL